MRYSYLCQGCFTLFTSDNILDNKYCSEYCKNAEVESVTEDMENPSKAASEAVVRGDGGATNYYELPVGATELKHLIKHKKMEHAIGEAFCALYRLNDNGEYKRNLKKIKYYIDSELEYLDTHV